MNDNNKIVLIHRNALFERVLDADLPFESPIDPREIAHNLLMLQRSALFSSKIGEKSIAFVVDFTSVSKGSDTPSEEWLKTFISERNVKKSNLVYIDSKGKIADYGKDVLIPNSVTASRFTQGENNLLLYLLSGNNLSVFLDGRIVEEIPDIYSLSEYRSFRSKIPVEEFEKILEKYQLHFIERGRKKIFWRNKKDFILVAAPEIAFIDDLYNFLRLNVSDAQIDEECLNVDSDDRLDVRLVRLSDSRLHIIEVKWIGTSDTSGYEGAEAEKRALSGVLQLESYLDHDSNCYICALVLFDARKIKDRIDWHKYAPFRDKIIFPPTEILMDPTSSSVMASKNSRKKYIK